MTVVDAPPAAAPPAGAVDRPPAVGGFAGLLGTVDHVGLGRLWVAASLLFLLAAGIAGALVGVERLDTADAGVLEGALGELYDLHATAAIFLFLLPAFLGIAIAVVPLQVGATTVAFPRAAAAAFWTWFLSGGVLLASYAVDGGVAGTDTEGVLLWTVGLGGVVVALVLGAVCVVTTVATLRTAGMTLDRVPPFSWAMFAAGTVWVLSLPVLFAGLVLHYLDVQYDAGLGAASVLGWAYGPMQVIAWAVPALGLLLEAAPVAAGVRQRHHGVLLGAIGATALLGFGAWTLTAGDDPGIVHDFLYVVMAFAVVLPLLVVAGGVADTLRRGRLNPTSPLLFGVVALLALLAGAVAHALRAIDGLELAGTTADPAVVHLVLGAGAIGVVGALHHWATKLFGAQLGEGAGRLAAVLLLLGGLALAVPDLVSGFLGQPAGVAQVGAVEDGVEALNALSLAGGALLLLAVLVVLVNIVGGAARRGEDVPADPWGGHTLEWATSSPPTPGGPGPIEPVTSPAPLLDRRAKEANA